MRKISFIASRIALDLPIPPYISLYLSKSFCSFTKFPCISPGPPVFRSDLLVSRTDQPISPLDLPPHTPLELLVDLPQMFSQRRFFFTILLGPFVTFLLTHSGILLIEWTTLLVDAISDNNCRAIGCHNIERKKKHQVQLQKHFIPKLFSQTIYITNASTVNGR
jgi:hypothetical protein